jgi:hypothetical protein
VPLDVAADPPNVINVTTDSSPGWRPTTEQRQSALKTVEAFLDALETGRYADAYAMQADVNKQTIRLEQFTQDSATFRALAGPVKSWTVLRVTWTKDPAQAPFPGIYVAIDLAAQFANVDRDCGYIVLYQPIGRRDFTIMRRENNYLDNATAKGIEEKQSKAGLAKVWAQVSRYCPNYAASADNP